MALLSLLSMVVWVTLPFPCWTVRAIIKSTAVSFDAFRLYRKRERQIVPIVCGFCVPSRDSFVQCRNARRLVCVSARTVCHRIIKSLIPSSCVPETAVLKLVSAVCVNRSAAETQVNLEINLFTCKPDITFLLALIVTVPWVQDCTRASVGLYAVVKMPPTQNTG